MQTKLPPGTAHALRELSRHGELTRRELQGLLDVSGPTVTRVVSHLHELGFVQTSVAGEGALGRPAETIALTDNGLGAIAVSITPRDSSAALVGVTGDVLETVELEIDAQGPYQDAIDRIASAVAALHDSAHGRFTALAGVGLSFGGSASFAEGRIITPSGFPQWHGRSIAHDVQAAVGIPAYVENQPVAYLRALHWFDGRDVEDRFVCFADYGLAGCFSSSTMPRPNWGVLSGGFGHVGGRVDGAAACWCGLFDCLNTRASLRALHAWGVAEGILETDAHTPQIIEALENTATGRQKLEDAAREIVSAAQDACRVTGIGSFVLCGAMFEGSSIVRDAARSLLTAHPGIAPGSFLPDEIVRHGPLLAAAASAADGMTTAASLTTLRPRSSSSQR